MLKNKQTLAQGMIEKKHVGLELGQYAKEVLAISNRKLQKAVRTRGLLLNGRSAHSKTKLKSGDHVQVLLPKAEQVKIQVAHGHELQVLYEDAWLLAVDKPADIPTYALQGKDGLANQVAGYYLAQGKQLTPRPLHRLDTPTSGVVLFAKDATTQTRINELWAQAAVRRFYFALCQGRLKQDRQINIPLQGARALTKVEVVKHYETFSELRLELVTGRTHQIRKHLALIGHPLLGDGRYGAGKRENSRLALHATSVSLPHPHQAGQQIEIVSPLPADLKHLRSG